MRLFLHKNRFGTSTTAFFLLYHVEYAVANLIRGQASGQLEKNANAVCDSDSQIKQENQATNHS